MRSKISLLVAVFIIVLTLFLNSIFLVEEGSQAVISRLGELNCYGNDKDLVKIYKPGLNFKLPLIDSIKSYDMRLRTLNVDSSRVVTREQKDVIIDAYIEWSVADIGKFYRSVSGNNAQAELFLKQFFETSLRAEVGKNNIQNLINNERNDLMFVLKNSVRQQALKIGVYVFDVRIKQVDLPDTVTDSIYKRMISERQKVAALIRAEGEQMSEKIRAHADASAVITIATAEREAKLIKAKAKADSVDISLNAFSKNSSFYDFWRQMEAYQESFSGKENHVFIMKTTGHFFKYFHDLS